MLGQTVDDFEVVVQNNGDDAETRELVEWLGDQRVKLFHTDAVVSMIENWERGLSQCTGELITVIGDDDALAGRVRSGGLRVRSHRRGSRLVGTIPLSVASYWHERRRNRLHADVTFDFVLRDRSSRAWLERFYAFQTDYSTCLCSTTHS